MAMAGGWRKLVTGAALAACVLALGGCGERIGGAPDRAAARLRDSSDGSDWAAYGRTSGAQHYSPLAEVNHGNVGQLGLAWSMDLPLGNTNTQPIAVDGVLYFATGLSVVHAVHAATGRLLWRHDPGAATRAGINLRFGWGVRGVAWWNGLILTGTQDGRLIALDARTGRQVWSVQTFPSTNASYISGAPRVFDGKVIIGFGGTTGPSRGYVTAYDAATGRHLWRFWTVPGDPSRGFENRAMKQAARTWAGRWWEYGGGGDVWNAISYDPDTDTVFIGTGSGYPWNRMRRSADAKGDRGDNWFICSIVALDGKTGAYKWHYQTVPGETWDFDSAMDIELADLVIDGRLRKVLIHAPKNGFFYVIDRITGKLISAEPFVRVTWASHVDRKTGRPVEAPGVRYRDGKPVFIEPTAMGGHNWMPMAWSPSAGLAFIPVNDFRMGYGDASKTWQVPADRSVSGANAIMGGAAMGLTPATGRLLAWNPVTQKPAWEVRHPTYLNGGVLATGGGLVFQGTVDGWFTAYGARDGKPLWRFDGKAPIMAAPISYRAGGRQYVTVITGLGMNLAASAAAIVGPELERYGVDPRSQARRVLTFAIGGKAGLPERQPPAPIVSDPGFVAEPERVARGGMAFAVHCTTCHGGLAIANTQGPDLRRSAIPLDAAAFAQVVHGGALVSRGMPAFGEFPAGKIEDLRHYIRASAAAARASDTKGATQGMPASLTLQ